MLTSHAAATIARMLAAAFLLVFVVGQAPHLVHHAFDHDEPHQSECPFAAVPDRLAGVANDTFVVSPVLKPPSPAELAAEPTFTTRAAVPTGARAPPFRAS